MTPVAAPLGGQVHADGVSGLHHHIDYGDHGAAWAALAHLVDAPSVKQARIRFAE